MNYLLTKKLFLVSSHPGLYYSLTYNENMLHKEDSLFDIAQNNMTKQSNRIVLKFITRFP